MKITAFYSSHSETCTPIVDMLEQVATEYPLAVDTVLINVDEEPFAREYIPKAEGLPYFEVSVEDTIIKRFLGAPTEDDLRSIINRFI